MYKIKTYDRIGLVLLEDRKHFFQIRATTCIAT